MALTLQPRIDLTFDARGATRDSAWIGRAMSSWQPSRLTAQSAGLVGEIYEETVSIGGDFRRAPYKLRATGRLRLVTGGSARRLREANFLVPNFPDFIGDPIRSDSGIWRGRLKLASGDWEVTFDSRRGLSNILREHKQTGGNAITHVGRLRRADGKRFSRAEVSGLLDDLHWFLSFVRGAWTSPLLVEAKGVRSSVWREWRSPRVDPIDGVMSWADPTHWASVAEAFDGFMRRCQDPLWRHAIRVAVGQYASANHPSPVESAIMAAQSGLELMGWLQLVETGKVGKKDWQNMSAYPASRKITELLSLGSIDLAIPTSLRRLVGLNPQWKNGPAVVAGVRNRLVHPRRSSRGVHWDGATMADAWLLSSSYLELAILHALGITGPIRNRILSPSPWVGSTISPPWAL
jgi:hypothetical protein